MFLDLVRKVGERDPDLARAALDGLRAYQSAEREPPRPDRPAITTRRGAALRDCGGAGSPVVLIPSLINPPRILDLDPDVSLADAIVAMGRQVLLVDWGPASERADLSVAGHIEQLLLPMLDAVRSPPVLIGYCLGGAMAIAAAGSAPVERVITLAAPWNFAAYPQSSRDALQQLWAKAKPAATALGALPIEVMQAAFWSLDPERTVRKFAHFAALAPGSAEARRFVELEEWANDGEPLPLPAARELIEQMFGAALPASGQWIVNGRPVVPDPDVLMLHLLARADRIAPSASAPPGPAVTIDSGHVGMVVGSRRTETWATLRAALEQPFP